MHLDRNSAAKPSNYSESYEFEQEDLYVTPVVIAEFYRGARNKDEFLRCRKLVNKFKVLSLTHDVTLVFDSLFDQYSLSHRPAVPDMLIAAAALHYQTAIYTLNVKDFNFIPDLKLIQ